MPTVPCLMFSHCLQTLLWLSTNQQGAPPDPSYENKRLLQQCLFVPLKPKYDAAWHTSQSEIWSVWQLLQQTHKENRRVSGWSSGCSGLGAELGDTCACLPLQQLSVDARSGSLQITMALSFLTDTRLLISFFLFSSSLLREDRASLVWLLPWAWCLREGMRGRDLLEAQVWTRRVWCTRWIEPSVELWRSWGFFF